MAAGAPVEALALAIAPIAPDPLVPDGSAPVKLTTVKEETTFWDRVAVTETPLRIEGANARHISEEPLCALVLTTSAHVNPAPETLWTVVLLPLR
jgi:hypothetical protein